MKNYFILIVLILTVSVITSCKTKSEKEIEERDAYLQENNITVAPTESGLYYVEIEEGTGEQAGVFDYVRVHYEGTFLNGEVFDSSNGKEPIDFQLGKGEVISGWDEGIAYMKEGGKAKLIIPSELAYGSYGNYSIPGYSTLVFTVELVKVN